MQLELDRSKPVRDKPAAEMDESAETLRFEDVTWPEVFESIENLFTGRPRRVYTLSDLMQILEVVI